MDKRRAERIVDNLDAEIVLDGVKHSGIVMNFSEHGMYLVTASLFNVADITSNERLDLKCHLPSGETLDMNCEVKWVRTKSSPYGVSFSMGMEIIDPPLTYRNFLKTAQ